MNTAMRTRKESALATGCRRPNESREFGFRCHDDDAEEIIAFARKRGVSVSEAIRTLITWGLEAEHDQ